MNGTTTTRDQTGGRWVISGLLLVLLLGGCTTGSLETRTAPPKSSATSLEALYNAAIFDSAIFRADRQVDDLRRVTGPAVMGSFSGCYQCDCQDCQTCSWICGLQPGRQKTVSDIWVSFSDEILDFCREFSQDELILRMQQLQGLPPQLDRPPESWEFLIVEIDGPEDLFRPCADPDPTTSGPCGESFPEDASEAHQAWIAGQALFAWQIPVGYPWTRLGYTYNWNPDAPSIVGTSEFVIPAGTEIEVVDLVTALDYCAP